MGLRQMLKNELKKSENSKKTISVILDSSKVTKLDMIVKGFSQMNPEKTFTRQKLIELAIDDLIEESNKILEENALDDLQIYEEEKSDEYNYDTVIFAAQQEGFEEAFLGENRWYYMRIGKDKINQIKYIACYVGAPTSAITHYAKVREIKEVMDNGKKKYIIYFDGVAIELPKPIPLGNVSSMAVRANRYVQLDTLFNAETYEDLIKG